MADGPRSELLSRLVHGDMLLPSQGNRAASTIAAAETSAFAAPSLSLDVLTKIMGFLDITEVVGAAAPVCRMWATAAAAPHLWRVIDLSQPVPFPGSARSGACDYADVTNDAVLVSFFAPRAGLMEQIDLSYCTQFSPVGLQALLWASSSSLQALRMRFCLQLDDNALLGAFSVNPCESAHVQAPALQDAHSRQPSKSRREAMPTIDWEFCLPLPSLALGTKRRRAMAAVSDSAPGIVLPMVADIHAKASSTPSIAPLYFLGTPATRAPLKQLAVLDLFGCANVALGSDDVLMALATRLPSLSVLDIRMSGVAWRRALSLITAASLAQWTAAMPLALRADAITSLQGLPAADRAMLSLVASADCAVFPSLALAQASLPVHSSWLAEGAERGDVLQSTIALLPAGCLVASQLLWTSQGGAKSSSDTPFSALLAVGLALDCKSDGPFEGHERHSASLLLPSWAGLGVEGNMSGDACSYVADAHGSGERPTFRPAQDLHHQWQKWLAISRRVHQCDDVAESVAPRVVPRDPALLVGSSLHRIIGAACRLRPPSGLSDALPYYREAAIAPSISSFLPVMLAQWPDDRTPPNADELRNVGCSFAETWPPLPAATLLTHAKDAACGARQTALSGLSEGAVAVIHCLAPEATQEESPRDGGGRISCKCCPLGQVDGAGCVWKSAATPEPIAARALRTRAALLAEQVSSVRAARDALDASLALHRDPLVHLYASWLADVTYAWEAARMHCAAALALVPECGTAAAFVAGSLLQAGHDSSDAHAGGADASASAGSQTSTGFSDSADGWLNRAEASTGFLAGTYHLLWEQRGVLRLREGRISDAVDCLRIALHFAPHIVDRGDGVVARALGTAMRRLVQQRDSEQRRRDSDTGPEPAYRYRVNASPRSRLTGHSRRADPRSRIWRPLPRQPHEPWTEY